MAVQINEVVIKTIVGCNESDKEKKCAPPKKTGSTASTVRGSSISTNEVLELIDEMLTNIKER